MTPAARGEDHPCSTRLCFDPCSSGERRGSGQTCSPPRGIQLASVLGFSTRNLGGREQPLSPTRRNTQPVSLDLPLPGSSSSRHGNGSSFSSSSHSLPGEDKLKLDTSMGRFRKDETCGWREPSRQLPSSLPSDSACGRSFHSSSCAVTGVLHGHHGLCWLLQTTLRQHSHLQEDSPVCAKSTQA